MSKVLLAGVGMGLFCAFAWSFVASFELNDKLSAALSVTVCVPLGVIVYFTLLHLLRFEELDTLKAMGTISFGWIHPYERPGGVSIYPTHQGGGGSPSAAALDPDRPQPPPARKKKGRKGSALITTTIVKQVNRARAMVAPLTGAVIEVEESSKEQP